MVDLDINTWVWLGGKHIFGVVAEDAAEDVVGIDARVDAGLMNGVRDVWSYS